jgi:hypothetical protein
MNDLLSIQLIVFLRLDSSAAYRLSFFFRSNVSRYRRVLLGMGSFGRKKVLRQEKRVCDERR